MLYSPTIDLTCQVGWSVNHATGEVAKLGCAAWRCDKCGPRKVRRFRERMARGGYNRLITLTQKQGEHEVWKTVDREKGEKSNLQMQSKSFARLRRFLKREYGLASYTWVREVSSTGRLHLHAVVRSRYIPQRLLSMAASRSGFGPVTDIRRIKNKGAVNYVTKYLSKGSKAVWPRYQRRVQTSVRKLPAPPSAWEFFSRYRFATTFAVPALREDDLWYGPKSPGTPQLSLNLILCERNSTTAHSFDTG